MDSSSVASSSSTPRRRRSKPIADRISRALRHPLRLLHRFNSTFFVLGSTGNVYTVTLATAPSCTCPDPTNPCKHILFIFIRVLGVSVTDNRLRRRTLPPCHLTRLLATPTSPASLAGVRLRERFHQLFCQMRRPSPPQPVVEIKDGTVCPVCLEEMRSEGAERVVACETCRNPIHMECQMMWKRSRRRRAASCVLCRARWRERADREMYVNLTAYMSEGDGAGSLCGD
ncbi:uncharacterized protein LOC131150600 [Malania oleifera]|uniref:uncharacterized protein LOC131150600 n=1 Tax=Malania oleifera TaxID=397392 RepID=UPI0025AEAE6C|nr:uncharacterized protein LOC131150600 [Malania oleifera]